ncbi:MAG: hypothetical protein J6K25_09810 [Thermoguttaceae bacterium]|nr:hypothetical protein [Thermoguttaceae bacterium]
MRGLEKWRESLRRVEISETAKRREVWRRRFVVFLLGDREGGALTLPWGERFVRLNCSNVFRLTFSCGSTAFRRIALRACDFPSNVL